MAYWSVFLWIPERQDWKVMFPIVRHFSKTHLVFKLSKAVRPYLPDFIPGYRCLILSLPSPPFSDTIRLYESLIQSSLKCCRWHPEALAETAWVWGTKFLITSSYSLFLVWYQGREQISFHLYFPLQSMLMRFSMNMPLPVYYTAQSENTQNDIVGVTFIVH